MTDERQTDLMSRDLKPEKVGHRETSLSVTDREIKTDTVLPRHRSHS
jgi:hypothetical protein